MRPYEVVIIFESSVEDSTVDAVAGRIRENLSNSAGLVGQIEKWGRRRFAYELRHRWEGYYVLIEFSAEPNVVADLDRMLLLNDDVVRHKIVRIPDSIAGRKGLPSKSEAANAAVSTGAPT